MYHGEIVLIRNCATAGTSDHFISLSEKEKKNGPYYRATADFMSSTFDVQRRSTRFHSSPPPSFSTPDFPTPALNSREGNAIREREQGARVFHPLLSAPILESELFSSWLRRCSPPREDRGIINCTVTARRLRATRDAFLRRQSRILQDITPLTPGHFTFEH